MDLHFFIFLFTGYHVRVFSSHAYVRLYEFQTWEQKCLLRFISGANDILMVNRINL